MRAIPALALMLAVATASCTHDNSAVPRRYAYPREAPCDTAVVPARLGDFRILINAGADITRPADNWLNIIYPRYGVTVHLSANSFADGEALQAAIANRRQRMELNFGDTPAEAISFDNNAGIDCTIAGSPDAGSAPVYITAVNPRNRSMLSGAAVFAGPTTPVDSIEPVYRIVYSHLLHMLETAK